MRQELDQPLVQSVGRKLKYLQPKTIDEYLQISANDAVWVEGLFTNLQPLYTTAPYTTLLHHLTPRSYTTTLLHHLTPTYTNLLTPPYTTLLHHLKPPYTTMHTPPFTTIQSIS
jgi:hypothetical protein